MCDCNGYENYHLSDDCDTCARRKGREAAEDNEPYENPYKNFSQAEEYREGYESVNTNT